MYYSYTHLRRANNAMQYDLHSALTNPAHPSRNSLSKTRQRQEDSSPSQEKPDTKPPYNHPKILCQTDLMQTPTNV